MPKLKLKPYKPKLTETDIKRQIKDYLTIKGWFHFHVLQGMGAYKGIPDRIAMKDHRILFLEVKRPNGKQSEYQREFQENVEKHGFEYVVAKSVDDLIEKNI